MPPIARRLVVAVAAAACGFAAAPSTAVRLLTEDDPTFNCTDQGRLTGKVADTQLVFIAGEQPLHLACSPQMPPETIKALADAPETMRRDGTVNRVTAEYEK